MAGAAQARGHPGEQGGHFHGVSPAADRDRVRTALLLIVAFMAAEVAAGVVSHSLALLSDAAHMLTDAGAIALSLVAMRLAARPPAGGLTFGLKRAEILSALANGVALFALAVLVGYEAVRRLLQPPVVDGRWMVGVAVAGVAVNLAATWQLARAERQSLNLRGSLAHIVTDVYAFAATALAGIVILATGFNRADALASLVVAALMLRAGYGLIRAAALVLMEAAPAGMAAEEVGSALASHPLVVDVHDFHVWEITSDMPALSAHVLVKPGEDCHAIRRELEQILSDRFHIDHTTLQVDHAGDVSDIIQVEPFRRPPATRSRPERRP